MTTSNLDQPKYKSFGGWRAEWIRARLPTVAEPKNGSKLQTWWTNEHQYFGSTFSDGHVALPISGGPFFSSPEMTALYFLFNNPKTTEQEFLDAVDAIG